MKLMSKACILLLCVLIFSSSQTAAAQAAEAAENKPNNGVCISMKVDSKKAYLNGKDITLDNAPFIMNKIAYVPLREVTELCGGIVQYVPSDRSVLVALRRKSGYALFTQMLINRFGILKLYNGWHEEPLTNYVFPVDKNYYPIGKNDRVFVPADYFIRFGYANVQWNPERNRIILSAFDNERGVGVFQLGEDFSLLNKSIRSRFKATGRVDPSFQMYRNDIYTDGDMEITLCRYDPRQYPSMKNKREIRKIVLLSSRYSTPRGLKVGDSVEKYLDLYDNDSIMYQFFVESQRDRISKIIITLVGG